VRVAAPNRTAQLRVSGMDISVAKEEPWQALASAAGCSSAEAQVGEIRNSRYGLGTASIMCPVAGARKLAQDGKIAVGWSTARITAIPKRPLQCSKELRHVRATCTSKVDGGHLWYRCGGSGYRARGCPLPRPSVRCASRWERRPTTGCAGQYALRRESRGSHRSADRPRR
jgi:hypothetical protein